MRFQFGLVAMLIAAIAAAAFALPALSRSQARVDPRAGGLTVALGEWSVVPEVKAIRPGTVTFVVTNRGRLVHAFRIRTANASGKNRLEARTRALRPGQTARLTIRLTAGVYDLECPVDDGGIDHEERGMHALLAVRADAPLVARAQASGNRVAIKGFAYAPPTLTVRRGVSVGWANSDGAPHTVTAANGSFSSPQLRKGGTYSRRFTRAGRFAYFCALHPQMKGAVVVR
jgi:plastocyanin